MVIVAGSWCFLALNLSTESVSGFGFRVLTGSEVKSSESVSGFGFRVSGFGFRVSGFGFGSVLGLR